MNKIKIFLISFLVLFAFPVLADEAFDIENFETDIQIHEDSTLTITETIDVMFNQDRHGIFRDIPTSGIKINVLGVENEKGLDREYKLEDLSIGTRIKIGDPDEYVNGNQTYQISYRVKNAMRFFEAHDELYWNATGNLWSTVIKKVKTVIHFPKNISEENLIQFKCFAGERGTAAEQCSYEYNDNKNQAVFKANASLSPYNGMTVVVGLPVGSVTRPAKVRVKSNVKMASVYLDENFVCRANCEEYVQPGNREIKVGRIGYGSVSKHLEIKEGGEYLLEFTLKRSLWYVLLLSLIKILLILLAVEPIYRFFKYGRDPKGRETIVPQYESPDDLSPSEMGTLLDESAGMNDISSSIIHLAVRGYLTIKLLPGVKFLFYNGNDYELTKINHDREGLDLFEKTLIDSLFGGDEKVKLSDLANKFYKNIPNLKDRLYESLIEKEYFKKSPSKVRALYYTKGILLIILGMTFPIELVILGSFWLSAFFIAGLSTLILAGSMPRKTLKGVEAYEHILGFKDYLKTAERDRIKFQEKENLFFKFLPYATVLGVADRWSAAFKDLSQKAPEWYQGDTAGSFNSVVFANDLQAVSAKIKSTLTAAPSSSSGSGFSGGSSGGGFGGGGGGSW